MANDDKDKGGREAEPVGMTPERALEMVRRSVAGSYTPAPKMVPISPRRES